MSRRIMLILMLLLAVGSGFAQETTTAAETATAATETTAASEEATTTAETTTETAARKQPASSYEVRNWFTALLRESPPQLAMMLKLDPTLLNDAAFVARYPQLAEFLAKRPEVRTNPHFYLAEFATPTIGGRQSVIEQILEPLLIFGIFAFIAFVLAWVVRTVIEQKRWNRLSKTQAEVHNKILDRFGSSDELLQYIKTPAGARFLESAPIQLREETAPSSPNPSFARVMWSIQIGLVVAAGALGMLVVSVRFEKETAQDLFAMGVIGFCIGLGFVASAIVSIVMSKRLAEWQNAGNDPNSPDRGLVR